MFVFSVTVSISLANAETPLEITSIKFSSKTQLISGKYLLNEEPGADCSYKMSYFKGTGKKKATFPFIAFYKAPAPGDASFVLRKKFTCTKCKLTGPKRNQYAVIQVHVIRSCDLQPPGQPIQISDSAAVSVNIPKKFVTTN